MSEMFRTLSITVDISTGAVVPSETQSAGVRGDDSALHLVFEPLDEQYRYQLEVVDGSGGYDVTLPFEAVNGKLEYEVPAAWSAPGIAAVRLVAMGKNGDPLIRHFAPIHLYFADREDGDPMGDMTPRWQTVMADAEQAAENATEAAVAATEAVHNMQKILVVTEKNGITSHSAEEIYAAQQEGYAIFLRLKATLIPISHADQASAIFNDVSVNLGGAKTVEYNVFGNDLIPFIEEYVPPIDGTLALPQFAADAAAVGKRFEQEVLERENLKSEITSGADKRYANALKTTVSGKILCLDDVNPLCNEVNVRVAPPTATLKRYGKNLFDYSGWVGSHITVLDVEKGEFIFNKSVSGIVNGAKKISALPNTAYHISGYIKDMTSPPSGQPAHSGGVSFWYTDGSNTNVFVTTVVGEYVYFSGTSRSDKTLDYVTFGGSGGVYSNAMYKEVQLEFSETATDYEPFNETEHTPNADGTVDGITALCTSVTLSAEGAVITAEYNQDANKVVEKLTQAILSLGGNV